MNRQFSRRPRYRNALLGSRSVVVIVIVLILVVLGGLRFAAPAVLARIAGPLWNVGASLSAHTRGVATTESKTSLRADRDRLSSDNAVFTAQNAALASQVADLTALLGSRTEPPKGIVARVLARPPVAPYDVLIVDQGADAGVSVGAVAQGPGGTPIGTVGESDKGQSRIALFSTSGLTHDGWIGSSHIPVTVTGAGAGAFRAEVPKQAGVLVGDTVYLASASALPIGTVVQIESDPSSPSVGLDVRPYVNPFSLTWVTISR